MKKILITGGSGFMGKNLVEHFSKNPKKYDILSPSHTELDLLDKAAVDDLFKKNKIDIIIHAANIGGKRNQNPNEDELKENLRIFFNIIEHKDEVKRIIFLGSGAEYGRTRNLADIKESDFGKIIPSDDYGFYKYACSKYIEKSDNIINLRIFGIFGKYEDYNVRFISNLICRDLNSLPIEINQNRVMDYICINDFCRIIEHFIENNPKEKFYNIGAKEHVDLISIAKKIEKISEKKFDIKIKKQGFDKEYTCNNKKLLKELKNFKFTDFKIALKELYSYYHQNKTLINKEELTKY